MNIERYVCFPVPVGKLVCVSLLASSIAFLPFMLKCRRITCRIQKVVSHLDSFRKRLMNGTGYNLLEV